MNSRRLIVFLAALSVFGLDRWSKHLVETKLTAFDTVPAIPGVLNIIRSQNSGVAFGIFSDSSSQYRTPFLATFSVVAVAILAVLLWRTDRSDRRSAIGLALIFGGALGNVFDRIRTGRVTDFLDLYWGQSHWYTFNIADTAISIGAALLLLSMWKPSGAPVHVA